MRERTGWLALRLLEEGGWGLFSGAFSGPYHAWSYDQEKGRRTILAMDERETRLHRA